MKQWSCLLRAWGLRPSSSCKSWFNIQDWIYFNILRFDKPDDGLPVLEDWLGTFESMLFSWNWAGSWALGLLNANEWRQCCFFSWLSKQISTVTQHILSESSHLVITAFFVSPWRFWRSWSSNSWSNQRLHTFDCDWLDPDCCIGVGSLWSFNSWQAETSSQSFGQVLDAALPRPLTASVSSK